MHHPLEIIYKSVLLGALFLFLYTTLLEVSFLRDLSAPHQLGLATRKEKHWDALRISLEKVLRDQHQLNHALIQFLNNNQTLNSSNETLRIPKMKLPALDDEFSEEKLAEDLDESFKQFWSDYTNEDIELLEIEMMAEKLRRFEESLDEAGQLELERRIQISLENLTNGTIPGFEMDHVNPDDFAYLTAPVESLSERDREFRESMMKGLRRTSLMKMKMEAMQRKALQPMDGF